MQSVNEENLVIAGDIAIDTIAKEVTINGNPVALTAKEYEILLLFAANPNILLPSKEIIEKVWGSDISNSNDMLYTHVKNLRKKIMATMGETLLLSVYGRGYRLRVTR